MPLKMDLQIRARWTAALRSGDYPQTAGHLRDTVGFCCMGVLCDLAARDGIIPACEPGSGIWEYGEEQEPSELPFSMRGWAGLDGNPGVLVVLDDDQATGEPEYVGLAELNDEYQWDFARIADAIDGGAA